MVGAGSTAPANAIDPATAISTISLRRPRNSRTTYGRLLTDASAFTKALAPVNDGNQLGRVDLPPLAPYHRLEPSNTMTAEVPGHYRLDASLGAGGMGTVYRAYDTRLERVVVLKLLTPAAGAPDGDSVLREARLASALNHPHICAVYEVGEAIGQAFIVMEHVEGQPLSSLIGPRGLPSDDVIRYGAQVADAIAHAHDRGVVRCDLKPQNIIVTADGRAKVLDFGIARRLQAAAIDATTAAPETTLAPAIAGTLPYMAPEVLRGERPDARSDIWSLDVVLHEMASGRQPFTASSGYARPRSWGRRFHCCPIRSRPRWQVLCSAASSATQADAARTLAKFARCWR